MKSNDIATLSGRSAPLATAFAQRALLERTLPEANFARTLEEAGLGVFRPLEIDTLQINVGKLCNQVCRHCHVDAGPDRSEVMNRETMAHCIDAAERLQVSNIDITGGAPEMNPHFRWLVREAAQRSFHVMVRCNLTYLTTQAGADLPEFFADNGVEVIASLPCYQASNTDTQRGDGVFEKSIKALRRLNAQGYGKGTLRLVLVTNPIGEGLPSDQEALERSFKERLGEEWSISFNALYAIANMPIARHLDWLEANGRLADYLNRLANAFNPAAAEGAMCRNTLNVGWDGKLFDCDFNQMMELGLDSTFTLDTVTTDALRARTIRTDRHCFGCTAGAGSSCGGATAD